MNDEDREAIMRYVKRARANLDTIKLQVEGNGKNTPFAIAGEAFGLKTNCELIERVVRRVMEE